MAANDWFRNEDWDSTIEARFFDKLSHARDKAKYLKIQARHLAKRHPKAALALLQRFFTLSGDSIFTAEAFLYQAEAYLCLGETSEAITALKAALQREREFPNARTLAWSEYADLVLRERKHSLYADALVALEEHKMDIAFPIHEFLWHGYRALIASELGDSKKARESAAIALRAAEAKQSPFRYHRTLGVVGDEHEPLKVKLRQLISESLS